MSAKKEWQLDSDNRLATILTAGVIAAAYHIAGRTAEDTRTAILKWMDERPNRVMTVGDLWGLTDWESNPEKD